jgi:hypothetical protein
MLGPGNNLIITVEPTKEQASGRQKEVHEEVTSTASRLREWIAEEAAGYSHNLQRSHSRSPLLAASTSFSESALQASRRINAPRSRRSTAPTKKEFSHVG